MSEIILGSMFIFASCVKQTHAAIEVELLPEVAFA